MLIDTTQGGWIFITPLNPVDYPPASSPKPAPSVGPASPADTQPATAPTHAATKRPNDAAPATTGPTFVPSAEDY